MFIYNFKINGTKVFKMFFICVVLLVIVILCISMYKIFSGANSQGINSDTFVVSDNIHENDIQNIDPKNYTNVLKSVCENIDTYVGKKIKFTGYVYRVNDLSSNQFILARNMLIKNDSQYVVVGFLCELDNAKDFTDDSWVEVTGEIQKGTYHGNDMPIIKVTEIITTKKPNQEYVNKPDETYIPTSTVL